MECDQTYVRIYVDQRGEKFAAEEEKAEAGNAKTLRMNSNANVFNSCEANGCFETTIL